MNSSVKEVFDILFVSKRRFKIEIDSSRLKSFILSYAIFKNRQIKKEEELKSLQDNIEENQVNE